MRQKDKNIEMEAKAGIQKSYNPVGLTLAAKDSTTNKGAASANRLSMRTGSLRASNSLQPHNLAIYGMRSNKDVARSQEASPEVGRKSGEFRGDKVASEEIVTFTDGGEHQTNSSHQPPVIRTTLQNANRKNRTSQGTRASFGLEPVAQNTIDHN